MNAIIKRVNYILLTGLLMIGPGLGCTSGFDDMNTNPNRPTTVTSAMLATKVILGVIPSSGVWNSEFLSKRLISGEGIDLYQYNSLGKGDFGLLEQLTNAGKMVELASETDLAAYTGLYYFMKGWAFYRTTLYVGDIPYSEALDVNRYSHPKYDEQKDVFKGILADLEQADNYFAQAEPFAGDPFYNGDPALWRKATNVLRLKVLMSLQRRADDTPELQVKQTFAQIAGGGNLFTGNRDNLQVVYSNVAGQENPLHVNNWRAIVNYAGSTTMIEPLKAYDDYRLFYYFAPMQALTDPLYLPEGESLLEGNDPDAYRGLDPTASLGDIYGKISVKMFNRINDIYRNSFEGIPFIRLGYADMNFILAEAAERGWIDSPAKAYYEEGIRASFDFVRGAVPDEQAYTQGMRITDEYIDSYIRSEQTAYKTSGSSDERIRQICTQSYFASFLHLQWDSYFEYRRTKYPELPVNPETNQNDQTDKIPMRWLYPQGEINYNKEQMDIALQRQWEGIDNINNLMWILR